MFAWYIIPDWPAISKLFSACLSCCSSYPDNCIFCCSSYPDKRVRQDAEGVDQGVMGTLQLQQSVTLSTQPICGFSWCPDKTGLCVCTSFDQTVRVLIVTKLNTLWCCFVFYCMKDKCDVFLYCFKQRVRTINSETTNLITLNAYSTYKEIRCTSQTKNVNRTVYHY